MRHTTEELIRTADALSNCLPTLAVHAAWHDECYLVVLQSACSMTVDHSGGVHVLGSSCGNLQCMELQRVLSSRLPAECVCDTSCPCTDAGGPDGPGKPGGAVQCRCKDQQQQQIAC